MRSFHLSQIQKLNLERGFAAARRALKIAKYYSLSLNAHKKRQARSRRMSMLLKKTVRSKQPGDVELALTIHKLPTVFFLSKFRLNRILTGMHPAGREKRKIL